MIIGEDVLADLSAQKAKADAKAKAALPAILAKADPEPDMLDLGNDSGISGNDGGESSTSC